jgi:hypothetical protein
MSSDSAIFSFMARSCSSISAMNLFCSIGLGCAVIGAASSFAAT